MSPGVYKYVCMCVSSWDTSLCCVCVCMCMYIVVFICVYMYKRHVCVYLGHRPVVCMCVPRCV